MGKIWLSVCYRLVPQLMFELNMVAFAPLPIQLPPCLQLLCLLLLRSTRPLPIQLQSQLLRQLDLPCAPFVEQRVSHAAEPAQQGVVPQNVDALLLLLLLIHHPLQTLRKLPIPPPPHVVEEALLAPPMGSAAVEPVEAMAFVNE